MSMYKDTYYCLFAAAVKALIKIDELEIKEAKEILTKALTDAEEHIISSDEEI